jgi:multiple sugar transport system permease protein
MMSLQKVELGDVSGRFVGLTNFIWVLHSRDFYQALWNTFVWVFGSIALEMALGLSLALMLNETFRGRGIARAIILAPYLIPTIVAILVWRYMFHDLLGIVNYLLTSTGLTSKPILWLNGRGSAMVAVIIVGVWKFFPFTVVALLGALSSIPQEQYEAARIDGAGVFQRFWRITLPYILPVFLLTALLRTIWTFNRFDLIYLLTHGGPRNATTTLPLLVYFKAFTDFDVGRAAAITVFAVAILCVFLVVYVFAIRRSEARQ